MSFSGMMQSGFGPGVVGILLAMLVLGGFGVLFLFAVDGGETDPTLATEAIIQQHETELHELNLILAEKRKQLESLPKLRETEQRLRKTASDAKVATATIEEHTATLARIGEQCAALKEDAITYKQTYRDKERAAAKGERMTSLTTTDGKTYKDVIIREVHPAGMRIGYDGGAGSKTIPYDKLPPELQDRFQFDPEECAAHLRREQQGVAQLTEADKRHKEATDAQRRQQEESDAKTLKDNARRAIPDLTRRISILDAEHEALKLEMEREKLKTVRNTEAIRKKIDANRATSEKLRADLLRAQNILNS